MEEMEAGERALKTICSSRRLICWSGGREGGVSGVGGRAREKRGKVSAVASQG
jgi:hypothetical protein